MNRRRTTRVPRLAELNTAPAALILATLVASGLRAADPDTPESLQGLKVAREFDQSGRKVLRYEHGANYFFFLPCKNVDKPPLRVVLHHAGGSGEQALKEAYAAKHRHQYGTDDHALLYLDCRNEQKTGGWWWGWNSIKKQFSS